MLLLSIRPFILKALLAVSLICSGLFQGCSVVKATSGEKARDLSVLNIGTDRYVVLAELGEPVMSEKNQDGTRVDVFKFVQGQHGAAKAGKAFGYGLLAVGTLGISELVTNPVEGTIGGGAEIQLKVAYDVGNKVSEVVVLKDNRWVPVQKLGETNQDSQQSSEQKVVSVSVIN